MATPTNARVPDPLAANPLAGNPLVTRADVAAAARDCYEPLVTHLSAGRARVELSPAGTDPSVTAALEGFARPLWGIAPLAAGGGDFAHWDLVRQGLESGTDPDHPEYWGPATDHDQRLVEMAAIGVALLLAPDDAWTPLPPAAQSHLVEWLSQIDVFQLWPNNWQFFRVIAHLGLSRVGRPGDAAAERDALDAIDALYVGEGWYRDGPQRRYDWYNAFAFHTYGLVYAASGLGDPQRSAEYRARAARFATQLRHWYAPDGAAVPYGRSMTYRFAQAAFWGALALADVEIEAMSWGEIKGLYLRQLRHWAGRPIARADGVLSVGYGYASPTLAEPYNSAGSPYWAMKAFLALAVPAAHPFWTAAEEPLDSIGPTVIQAVPRLMLSHDAEQVLAVTAGQSASAGLGQARAKYGRFAYSSRFGFTIDDMAGDETATSDSTLWLTDGRGIRRIRDTAAEVVIEDDLIAVRWCPWPDVIVDTVLWGQAPWHGRLHRIRSGRRLMAHEWGFALGLTDEGGEPEDMTGAGIAVVTSPLGRSGLVDPSGSRPGRSRRTTPGANLEWPTTVVPFLAVPVDLGTSDLMALVFGSGPEGAPAWDRPPEVPAAARALLDRHAPPWSVGRAGWARVGAEARAGAAATRRAFSRPSRRRR